MRHACIVFFCATQGLAGDARQLKLSSSQGNKSPQHPVMTSQCPDDLRPRSKADVSCHSMREPEYLSLANHDSIKLNKFQDPYVINQFCIKRLILYIEIF